MQQPRMIVLSLLGIGLRYGFEMEDFARRTNMRQWAKIGMSTFYKVLGDLEREGAVSAREEESAKGPVRKAYVLTEEGRAQMIGLIGEALASDVPIYSERIAGLVFAPLLGAPGAKGAITGAVANLERADALLAGGLEREDMDTIGSAIVEYYRAIFAAEREAMRKVLAAIR